MRLGALRDISSELRIVPYDEIRKRRAALRQYGEAKPVAIKASEPEPFFEQAPLGSLTELDYLFVSTSDVVEGSTRQYCIKIVSELCQKYKVTIPELLADKRSQNFCRARGHIWWLLRRNTTWSLPKIGEIFNRNHTNVLNGVRRFQKDLDEGRVTL